jgi:hypothetical protein
LTKILHGETMDQMKCPDCGAKSFYVKDSEDQYNISEFSLDNGAVEYLDGQTETDHIPVLQDTEIFCDRCAWHDRFETLKKTR